MAPSKVFFTDFRVQIDQSRLMKLTKLMNRAGADQIDFEGKFVAIKIHFGEPGNLAYLRPNYARTVVDYVKARGGKPFLTDCNTLYPGRRKNALEHMEAAWENGFTPLTVGCPIIIADGLKGTDEALVPVHNGVRVKEAKIGHAIMDADIVISLNHFKGHEMAGFGGAVKNLGMGSGSRAGKMEQHNNGKPEVRADLCRNCKLCSRQCAQGAISYDTGKAVIDHDKCVGCGRCIGGCNFDAIRTKDDSSAKDLNCKMAEYAQAVCYGRPNFHINMVMDISPNCDCHAENDAAILPDVGMFVSYDPVALDQACVDACQKQTPIRNSQLGDNMSKCDFHDHHDHFKNSTPESEWKSCLEHAELIGLGTREYELVVMK